jgi:hypothetical protein
MPLRLLLGSDAYQLAHTTLSARVAAIEAQHDITTSTDADDYTSPGSTGLESLQR